MNPLVSCLMPTWNRRSFIPAAVDCFLWQTYEPRELIILDDGEEPIEDLIPRDPRIRYVFEDRRRITGDKRNRACELATGEIICHFDDDDWSAPTRIQHQVDFLLSSGKSIVGYENMLFWHVERQQALIYRRRRPGYVLGTSFCYRKKFWESHRFKSRQVASDNDFINSIPRLVGPCADLGQMVARIHNCHHTSPKANISIKVQRERIPAGFWENEELRCRVSAS